MSYSNFTTCDFLVSRSPYQADMEAPIVVMVKAKQEDFDKGTTQCIAEMIGARIFNKREGNSIEEIYGVVTTGNLWQFSVLRKTRAEIDPKTFDISGSLEQIFGILWAMTFSEIALQ